MPETTQLSLESSSKADNNSSLADSKWQFSEVGTVASSMQTDDDIKEVLRQATANILGRPREERTISSTNSSSAIRTLSQVSDSSSNFSVSKAFGVTKKKMKDIRTTTPSPVSAMIIDTSPQGSKQGLMSLDKNITVASSFSVSVQRKEVQPRINCNKTEITQDRASKLLKDESKKRATKLLQKLDETKRVRATTSKRESASESPELLKSKKSQKQKLLERLEKMGVKPEEVGLSTDGHTVGRSKSSKTKKTTKSMSINPFDDDFTVDVGDKYAPTSSTSLNDDFLQDVMAMAAGHLGGIDNTKSMDEILNAKEAQPDALQMLVKPESADMDDFLNFSKLGQQRVVLAKAKAARANQANVAPSFGNGKPPQSPMVRANSMTEADADWVAQDLVRKNEWEKEAEECTNECSLLSAELFDKADEEVISSASLKAPHSPSVMSLSKRLAAISGKSKVSARDKVNEELRDLVGLDALGDELTIESSRSERYMSTEASIVEKRSFAEKAASKAISHKALSTKKIPSQDAGTAFCDMMEMAVAPSTGGSCRHNEEESVRDDRDTSNTANWCVSFNGMIPPNQLHQTPIVRSNVNSPKAQDGGVLIDGKSLNSLMDINGTLRVPEQLTSPHQSNTSQVAVVTSQNLIPAEKNAVSPSASSRKSDFFDKGSLLDQDDAFWDSLSTIASSAPLKQQGQVLKTDQPRKFEKIDEEDITGCGIGCPWEEDQQPSAEEAPVAAMTAPKAMKAANPVNGDSDSDFSVAPSIPVEITYRASHDDGMAGRSMIDKLEADTPDKEQPVGKTMDNLQTLLSGDSSSSDSSLLYSANGTTDNENEAHISAEELEKAMMRGLEMASTNDESAAHNSVPSSSSSINRRASKYGDDQGEQPLCSPSLPSHDSDSQPANASPVDELEAIVRNVEGMDVTVTSPVSSLSKKAHIAPKKGNSRVSSMLAKFQSTREDMNYKSPSAKKDSKDEILVAANDDRLQSKANINDDCFDLGAIDHLLKDAADDDSFDTCALLLVVTRTEDEPNTISSLEDDVPDNEAIPRAPVKIEEWYDDLNALPRSRASRIQDKESGADHRPLIKIEERYEEVELCTNLEQMLMNIPGLLPLEDADADSSLEVQAQTKSKGKNKGPKSKNSPKSKNVKEESHVVDYSRKLTLEIDDLVIEKLSPQTEEALASPTFAANRAHQKLPKDELMVSPTIRKAPIPVELQTPTVSQENKKRYESPSGIEESPSTPRLDFIRARLDEKRRLRDSSVSPGLLRSNDTSLIVTGRSSSTRPHLKALASPVAPPVAGPEIVAMQEMLEKYDTMVSQLLQQNGKLKRNGNTDDISVGADSADVRRMLLELRRQKEQSITHARSGSAGRSRPSTPNRGRGPPKPEDASPRVLLSTRAQDDSPTDRRPMVSKATTLLRSTHSPLASQHFHFDCREPRSSHTRMASPERRTSPLRMASPERHTSCRTSPLKVASPERRTSPLKFSPPNRGRTSPGRQERHYPHNRQRAESRSPSRQRFMLSPERKSRWSSPERSRLPSPDRRRRIAFAHDNAEQARSLREQLDMARLTSQSIRTNQSSLSLELQAFKKKLNEKRKERTMMSAFRDGYDDHHNHDHASVYQFHQEEEQYDDQVEDPWGNPDDVRDMMLSNLKLMNDARDALISERMRVEAEEFETSKEERLYRLEKAISDIRLAEQTNSGRVMQCLDDARGLLHAETKYSKSNYNL